MVQVLEFLRGFSLSDPAPVIARGSTPAVPTSFMSYHPSCLIFLSNVSKKATQRQVEGLVWNCVAEGHITRAQISIADRWVATIHSGQAAKLASDLNGMMLEGKPIRAKTA
jgi:hypothetical protein